MCVGTTFTTTQVGDRVWYWDGASRTVYGTVTAIERLADVRAYFLLSVPDRDQFPRRAHRSSSSQEITVAR